MKFPHRMTGVVTWLFAGAMFLAPALEAQTSYWGAKNWDFVCGGNEYYGGNFLELCASVHLSVTQHPTESGVSLVTMDVWNLSELAGPYEGSGTAVFTKVAFFNTGATPTTLDAEASMWGATQPKVKGGKLVDPDPWVTYGFNHSGGIGVDFGGNVDNGVRDGIASGCTDPGIRPIWVSGTWGDCFEEGDVLTNAVTIQFRIADFLFNFDNLGVAIHAQNMGPGGEYSSTLGYVGPVAVIPEPGTWVLLATGLLGVIVAWRRRESGGEVEAEKDGAAA